MKTTSFLVVSSIVLFGSSLTGHAASELSEGAVKWCNWASPHVGAATNFYANNGTFAVAADGNGIFGNGLGEVTFTSNNENPIAEHQFGNSIWAPGKTNALIDAAALAGTGGLEILVNVDPSSTSDKICIKLMTTTADEVYVQTVPVEKGSIQLAQFPLAGFKNSKNPEERLEDFSKLKGTIQVTDGWNGFPKPAQESWVCKFSNIYTYAGETEPAAATGTSPSKR